MAYPSVPLGNYDVPTGWPGPVARRQQGQVFGPPVNFLREAPQEAKSGVGFKPDYQREGNLFFFHTDHIGSTSYLTDTVGNVSQFLCYTPYGEAIVDEHLTSYENPFKFSGKELDDITGLYDHGARSKNPISTLWYGVDPRYEEFPEMSPFAYCHGNPVRLVDLNGMQDEEQSGFLRCSDISSKIENISNRINKISNSNTQKKFFKKQLVLLMMDCQYLHQSLHFLFKVLLMPWIMLIVTLYHCMHKDQLL